MKLKYPGFLTPVLFVTFCILNLFGRANIHKVFFTEALLPWGILVTLAFLIYFTAHHLVKHVKKTEIVSFILILLLTAYGHAANYLSSKAPQIDVHLILFPAWIIFGIIALYTILSYTKSLASFAQAIRVMSASLVIMGLLPVISPLLGGIQRGNIESPPPDVDTILAQADVPQSPPDIYYLILDGYGREDALQRVYGYDNSAFIEALQERGFYVAPNSRSNYLMTFLSLASSLNMQHITYLVDHLTPRSLGVLPTFHLIRNNKVMRTLDALGYTTIHFSSGWEATKRNPQADVNVGVFGINQQTFNYLVLTSTILNPLADTIADHDAYNRVTNNFNTLEEVPAYPEPTFAFAHLMVPHPPFVFDSEGNFSPADDAYLNQLIYANKRVLEVIDTILAQSDGPALIILQADHGLDHGFLTATELSDSMIDDRSAILNAYYFPDGNTSQLYADITPVNSFRIIFNQYFGTELPLVDDTVYASVYSYPYAFSEWAETR